MKLHFIANTIFWVISERKAKVALLSDCDEYYVPEGHAISIECVVSGTSSDVSQFTVGIKQIGNKVDETVRFIDFSKDTNTIIDRVDDVELSKNNTFIFTLHATSGNGGLHYCIYIGGSEYAQSNTISVVIQGTHLFIFYHI